jgi:SAM-dependent methyltransferase
MATQAKGAAPEPYWGEIPRTDMEWLVQEAERGRPWREAITSGERTSVTRKAPFILDTRRASWMLDLPVKPEPEVLDVGAGLGGVAAALAPYAGRVIALEPVSLRARFIALRARQDGLRNVEVARASALALPLRPSSIDVAVLSGVLEWVGKGSRDPARAQLEVLRAIRRVLRPDGVLVIGIENRTGIWFFLGRQDHSYLPFTGLLPRPLASLVTRSLRGHPYDTYTYTHPGYRRLLAAAGFEDLRTVLPIWSYNSPEYLMPLAAGPRQELTAELMGAGGRAAPRPMIRRAHLGLRLSQAFANDFIFYARSGPPPDPGWLRRVLAPHWPSYGLPGRASELEFLIRNRSQPTLIAFPSAAATAPCAVLRLSAASADRTTFSPARHEIATLRELTVRLPAEIAAGLPRPLDLLSTAVHDIGVTSYVPGSAPMLPAPPPGPAAAVALGDLSRQALGWLGDFHRALGATEQENGGRERWPELGSRALAGSIATRLAAVSGCAAMATALVEHIPDCVLGRVALRPQHGDFVLSNLRQRPHGKLGVIDWERFGRVPMPGFDAMHFTSYALVCLLAAPRTQAVDAAEVVHEVLSPGPLGRAVQEPLASYLAEQGFASGSIPVLYPIYLAAFIAEYGFDRERQGIVSTMKRLLEAALAFSVPLGAGSGVAEPPSPSIAAPIPR